MTPQLLQMPVLTSPFEFPQVESRVELHTLHHLVEHLIPVRQELLIGMTLLISPQGIPQPLELLVKTFNIALAQPHTTVTPDLITQETNIEVAVPIALAP